jgi:hypothetical protein
MAPEGGRRSLPFRASGLCPRGRSIDRDREFAADSQRQLVADRRDLCRLLQREDKMVATTFRAAPTSRRPIGAPGGRRISIVDYFPLVSVDIVPMGSVCLGRSLVTPGGGA